MYDQYYNIIFVVSIKNNKEMTQQEFEEKTGMTPSIEEFDYIHAVYMDTFMDKEEFCKDFKKHGNSKIIREVHTRATNFELQCKHDNELFDEMAAFLIGKSRAYNDTDFRKMAVNLIGEKRVVLKTVEMGLPLCGYDNDYIIENLK